MDERSNLGNSPLNCAVSGLVALLLLLGAFGLCGTGWADDQGGARNSSARLDVEPKGGTLDDSFRYTVSVENADDTGPPLLTGGDDFRLVLVGRAYQLVNGTSRTVYEYQLFPKKAGALEAPVAEITVNGKKLVLRAPAVQVSQGTPRQNGDLRDVFLSHTVQPNRLYLGQQGLSRLELFTSRELASPQFLDLSFDDFWQLALPDSDPGERIISGIRFRTIAVRRAIFPLKTGIISIPARKVQTAVITRRNVNLPGLGGIFSLQTIERIPENRTLESNPVDVEVLPLPPQPPDYDSWGSLTPVVGDTALRAVLLPQTLQVGESATLKIEVSSEGNLSGLQQVPVQFSKRAKVYPEGDEVKTALDNRGKVVSTRTFRVSIVPLEPGEYALDNLSLSYFDPQAVAFKRAEAPQFRLKVSGQMIPGLPARNPQTAPKIETAPTPLAPTPSPVPLRDETVWERLRAEHSSGWILMVAGAVLLVILTVFGLRQTTKPATGPNPLSLETVHGVPRADALQILARRLSLAEDSGVASVRATALQKIDDEKLRFMVVALLDYLGERTAAEVDVVWVRDRLREILGAWPDDTAR